AQQDHCLSTPTLDPGDEYNLTQYDGCAAGSSVELYTIFNEGHEWPGGPHLSTAFSDALGPQSDAVDADSVMWKFFAAHPMS
ncbi:MAG: hypothetical protein ACRDYC_00245, partial [Acidimicrobiales bacterium]